MSPFVKLMKFIKPHQFWLITSAITTMAIGVIEPFIVYLLKDVTNSGLAQQKQELMMHIVFFLSVITVGMCIKYVIKLATTRFSALTLQDIRDKVTMHIQKLPIPTIEKYTTGDLISRMTNDAAVLQRYFINHFCATKVRSLNYC